MEIKIIKDKNKKLAISSYILEDLKTWFAIDESRKAYINESKDQLFLACFDGDKALGFLTLKRTGDRTCELAVMGVLRAYHRMGIGRDLVNFAKKLAYDKGYWFLQVKTLKMGSDLYYDKTNSFYKSMGFSEFELIEDLWGEDNPCQIYILSLREGANNE